MSDIIVTWASEIEAELVEARAALDEVTTAAQQASERHQAALARAEAVKLALGRLPGLGASLAAPIAGRVTAAAAEVEMAAMEARRALQQQQQAAARVDRLETATDQLAAVLAASVELEEVAA